MPHETYPPARVVAPKAHDHFQKHLSAARSRGREIVAAYTGDTEECPAAIDLARDVDLLIAECSVADEDRVPGHLTPRGVGRVAAAASARQVVATHFYPSALALGADEIRRRIRESYAREPIDLGTDGLAIDL